MQNHLQIAILLQPGLYIIFSCIEAFNGDLFLSRVGPQYSSPSKSPREGYPFYYFSPGFCPFQEIVKYMCR